MVKPLILVSNRIQAHQENEWNPAGDFAPRQDYLEIARMMNGTVIGSVCFDKKWLSWIPKIEKQMRLNLTETFYALHQFSAHNIVFSTSEKVAIPLTALMSITKCKIPHVVMAHKLSSGFKMYLAAMWPFHKSFDHVISDCRFQVDYAINQLNLPQDKVDFIYHNVDHLFYHPLNLSPENYILAVGQEQRDYRTLLDAIAGTGIKLVVVASSPWSTSRIDVIKVGDAKVVSHIPYQDLRDLYARARMVVTPLKDVDYAAGNSAILEAMAMGKATVVSRTRGIAEYVIPNETGFYVSPHDPAELQNAILSLWNNPKECKRLGSNGRQWVEEKMNLDIYVNRIAEIVTRVTGKV